MRRRFRSAATPVPRQAVPQLLLDLVLVALAYWLAYAVRFDGTLPGDYERLFNKTIAFVVPGSIAIFAASGLYRPYVRQVLARDVEGVARGAVLATLALVAFVSIFDPASRFAGPAGIVGTDIPASITLLHALLMFVLLASTRYVRHRFEERPLRGFHASRDARRVLIVGAGEGGRLVLREILRNPSLNYRPIGFVDDAREKQGVKVERGLKVLGTTGQLPRILDEHDPDEVLIAVPSAPGTMRAKVVSACRDRGIGVRTLPTVFELLQGGSQIIRQVRDVEVQDVLGREPVRMELDAVGSYLTGQVVMITGAGGSIGSELCRQISRVGPRKLVLLDHAEDNLFEILRELEHDRHVSFAVGVLADCKAEERMREVFAEHRPAYVFHAAAYKHVGLMEDNPVEAVRNNAIGTRVMARVAGDAGTRTFVLVSTDKAVNPATVMGASKLLAEWAVEAAQVRHPDTRFTSVRFGNVLGSSGSVVPIFRRQIAQGGPVTVTDPAMTRFFMTIPEAVQLIINAGKLTLGGEVFVLDMGEPVNIMDLARQMIRLSGLEPGRDIAIDVIGRRAGEKTHEELFNPYERAQLTTAERIHRADRERLDPRFVEEVFDAVGLLVLEGDAAAVANRMAELSHVRAATTRV